MKPLVYHLDFEFPPAVTIRPRPQLPIADRVNSEAMPYWLRRDSVAVISSQP